jgi:hypothetical protein
MRKFLRSRRGRYALAFVVVGTSLAVMGAQCQPTKEQPAPLGLSISPIVGDFESQPVSDPATEPITFTVTNNGPGDTGVLDVQDPGAPFAIVPLLADDCDGATLAEGETCFVDVTFDPVAEGGYLVPLVVDDPSNGEVSAVLGGVGTV